MRPLSLLLLLPFLTGSLQAQASIASDLWRVAAGTHVVPPSLATDGMAPLWTPAVVLPADSHGLRVGVEAVHAPAEIGLNAAAAAVSWRTGTRYTLSVAYARAGLSEIGYTETSPDLIGTVPVDAQTLSLGLGRRFGDRLTAGLAVRVLSGRLADVIQTQPALDAGIILSAGRRIRLGIATQFFDPAFREAQEALTVNSGVEWRSATFDAWGTPASATARYGLTLLSGERAQHLLTAGIASAAFSFDAGAVREDTGPDIVWRSRAGLGLAAGRYRVLIARDGGVHGFGATWRFSLTLGFR